MILAVVGLWVLLQVTASTGVKYKHSTLIEHLSNVTDGQNVIPIPENQDGPLKVTIKLGLIEILEVDVSRNQVEVEILLALNWQDKALAWDLNDEGMNYRYVNFQRCYMWRPDITVVNSISKPEVLSPRYPSYVVIQNDGTIKSFQNLRVRVSCNLKDLHTNQGASCFLSLTSWAYTNEYLSISSNSSSNLDVYAPHPRYEILSTSDEKNSVTYPCCPGVSFDNLKFNFVIKYVRQNLPPAVVRPMPYLLDREP